jgi:hypothetical protein
MKTKVSYDEFLELAYDLYKLSDYPKSLDDIPADIISELETKYKIKDKENEN